ncbi:Ras-associating and dilute domain-containing protein [Nibea albiflora]|nr:Ras-associating and dilute domain-containing protein [Nibea albiflora]
MLLQELWKPREGHARRFELRRRAEVEELNAKEKDTVTAGPKTSQFLAALMGRSGLGKHRSSPLRCGRVVQSSSKGGDWSQDCLVYLLNREQHTVGQEPPSARPNICLFSPDILPLHCRLRRVPAPRRHASNNNKGEELAESQQFCVAVEPVLHATVLVNFSRCEALHHAATR